ncbi:hypothetical protein [Comamonas sp. A7-5]|nr:hypothetical protein P609_11310 [Comamonas thiooxydans]
MIEFGKNGLQQMYDTGAARKAAVEALLYLHATRCFDEFSVIN